LNDFKENLATNYAQVDSLVVVIMSHGAQDKIEMADGKSVHLWNDIVYKFRGVLPHKPKIFIVQACQEFKSSEVENQGSSSAGVMPDTLVCFPTQPGTLANRDIYLGGWFIYCFTKVLMENAHNTHLLDMLKMVCREKCITQSVIVITFQHFA
jgi:hypothetical protein